MPPILPARAPTRGDTNFGALQVSPTPLRTCTSTASSPGRSAGTERVRDDLGMLRQLGAIALPIRTSRQRCDDIGGFQQVHGGERSARAVRGGPVGLLAQVGLAIPPDQPDYHLGDDPTTDGPELLAAGRDLRLPEDVEPERRPLVEVEVLEVV